MKPFALWRKITAAYNRTLAAPLHNLPLMGDPANLAFHFSPTSKASQGEAIKRRAILWAVWKARKLYGLPTDLSQWTASATEGDGIACGWLVTLSPSGRDWQTFKTVRVAVPAWPIASEPEELPPETPAPRQISTAKPASGFFAPAPMVAARQQSRSWASL